MPTEIEKAQIELLTHLRAKAAGFYDDRYQPLPHVTRGLVYKGVADSLTSPVDRKFIDEAAAWLTGQNIVECSEYKRGGSAVVLAARTNMDKACVIRIPTKFDDPEAHKRFGHAAILQPFATLPYQEGSQIEILPFVPFTGTDSGLSGSARFVLHEMHRIIRLTVNEGIKNDLGVFPDGTPMFGDPDVARPDGSNRLMSNLALCQQDILRHFPLVAPILWVDKVERKQRRFFPTDYLSTPLSPKAEAGVGGLDKCTPT